MKKIIILFISIFFLTGCYDYDELNNLAIVSGIAIDYQNDEFEVTFEILQMKKDESQSTSENSFTISSKAKDMAHAFSKNANKIDKGLYFDHIDVVIISDNVAKNELYHVNDYIIRNPHIRNEFYLVVAKDTSAKELIEKTSEEHPTTSAYIMQLLENNISNIHASFYEPYMQTLNKILTSGQDAYASAFNISDEVIELDGVAVFHDFNLVGYTNLEEASLINILTNYSSEALFKAKCENDKYIIIRTYDSNTSINPKDDKVIINIDLKAKIDENFCDYDLDEPSVYNDIEDKMVKVIEKDFMNVINIIKENKSDILKIGKKYYNKTRKEDFSSWLKKDIELNVKLNVNKKCLIFEVDYEQ